MFSKAPVSPTLMQVDWVDPDQWLPYMPGFVLCKWLELGAAKGRGTLNSDSCLVLSKLRGTLLVVIPLLHCLSFLFRFFSKRFCRSMIAYTWLLWSACKTLTIWKRSRIEMVQILSNSFQVGFWCHVDTWCGLLKGSLCLGSCQNCEDAANAHDSSPDAQCQADILAISAADAFFSTVYNKRQSFEHQGSKIWIGCQDASENPLQWID